MYKKNHIAFIFKKTICIKKNSLNKSKVILANSFRALIAYVFRSLLSFPFCLYSHTYKNCVCE